MSGSRIDGSRRIDVADLRILDSKCGADVNMGQTDMNKGLGRGMAMLLYLVLNVVTGHGALPDAPLGTHICTTPGTPPSHGYQYVSTTAWSESKRVLWAHNRRQTELKKVHIDF